jgi:cardiolipin synthase A/B
VGFMGSQNMVDPSYNKRGNIRRGLQWKDLMVRVEGPIVAGVNAIFITDWFSETDELLTREADPVHTVETTDTLDCQIVPSGPGFEGENNLRLFNALLYAAQERLVIVSPYFVPDDSMLYAITTAAERGVKVQLFACEVADQAVVYHAQRSYYETLLRAGVRIYLYEKPIVLHAKHFTVDDDVAVIGSSNMDMRSFSLNFEVSLLVRGRRFVDKLRRLEDSYRTHSRELTLEEWLERPTRSQVLDNLARLTASVQ